MNSGLEKQERAELDEALGGVWTPGGEPDFCTRAGAQHLKSKIEAYWLERGHKVSVQLHNVGFHPAIRAARYDVRSDMVNGMPRRGVKKPVMSDESVGER